MRENRQLFFKFGYSVFISQLHFFFNDYINIFFCSFQQKIKKIILQIYNNYGYDDYIIKIDALKNQ
jgi:hypothetical protein